MIDRFVELVMINVCKEEVLLFCRNLDNVSPTVEDLVIPSLHDRGGSEAISSQKSPE